MINGDHFEKEEGKGGGVEEGEGRVLDTIIRDREVYTKIINSCTLRE